MEMLDLVAAGKRSHGAIAAMLALGFQLECMTPALAATTIVDSTQALLSQAVRPIPQPVPVKEGMISVGDARLQYWDTGGPGDVVLLMHPGTSNAAGWGYQQPALAKAGYRVIAYSRRGHAGSEPGAPDAAVPASEDLRKLLDALGVEKFHAVGVAAGGIYSADFALSYPKRLKSLTIAGSIVAVDDVDYMKRSGALRPKSFSQLPHEFQELGPQYRAVDPEGVQRWKQIQQANTIDPTANPAARQPPKNKLTLAALKTLTLPVLLMTGDADLYMPPIMMRELSGTLPNNRTFVIPGSGHAPYWEQPDIFNARLLAFLQSVTPGKGNP